MVPHRRGRFEYAPADGNPAIRGPTGADSGCSGVVFQGPPGAGSGGPSVAKFIPSTVDRLRKLAESIDTGTRRGQLTGRTRSNQGHVAKRRLPYVTQ